MIPKTLTRDNLRGRKCRTISPIKNGAGHCITPSTLCTIVDVIRGHGFVIKTNVCPCCGQQTYISRVSREDLVLSDESTHEHWLVELRAMALSVAQEAHRGQVDKGGHEYILHPLTVAAMVYSFDESIVALLHDTVEDTDVTLQDLLDKGFPPYIVEAVDAISRRRGEGREDYIRRVKQNRLAAAVKIADLRHNSDLSRIPNPTEKDQERVKRYTAEIQMLQS